MHIEFRLPTGAGGMAAGHVSAGYRRRIKKWAEQHGDPSYSISIKSYTLILEFDDPKYYTLFLLEEWNFRLWSPPVLVNDQII